jgi:hypothetical protein
MVFFPRVDVGTHYFSAYTRSSQESTDLSLGHLSDELQLIRFKLQSQIASLRPKLASTTGTSVSLYSQPSAPTNHVQLLDAINSATAVASLISINKHFYIPQIVSSIFTGREQYLADLQQHFDVFGGSTNPTRIQKRFIIYGLGGSGKTQFCCKFAQHNRQK